LGLSLYDRRGWTIAIEKYNDIFFLKELKKPFDKENVHDNTRFGFIFEKQILDDLERSSNKSNEISMKEGMYVANSVEFESVDGKDKKIKVFAPGSIDGLDGDEYIEAKTRDLDGEKKYLDLWLQMIFSSTNTLIQGIKSEEDGEIWIRKIRKETLEDVESAFDKTMRENAIAVIHQILDALISNYDSFMEELMTGRYKRTRPQIMMVKTGKGSKDILFSENMKPAKILTDKFKNRFPET